MNSISSKTLKSNNNEETGNKCTEYRDRIRTPSTKISYSPVFSQHEDVDNIDVVWDWNSPKSKPRISKQKVIIQQSPKLLIKRNPSNDQISVFNKLEEELKTLTDKAKTNESKVLSKSKDLQDFFNDSMEEKLLMCSQQVEDSVVKKVKYKSEIGSNTQIQNDSFDCMFAAIKDEDLNLEKVEEKAEIIKKEFLDDSPIKCSPEEIEQKRLQALAKLEVRKKQKIIEQNRQQALKRLELSRKRRILH